MGCTCIVSARLRVAFCIPSLSSFGAFKCSLQQLQLNFVPAKKKLIGRRMESEPKAILITFLGFFLEVDKMDEGDFTVEIFAIQLLCKVS